MPRGLWRPCMGDRALQRLDYVGERHDARRDAEVSPAKLARIAGADQGLVLSAGALRRALHVFRQGQLFEHDQVLHDMFIDREAPLPG